MILFTWYDRNMEIRQEYGEMLLPIMIMIPLDHDSWQEQLYRKVRNHNPPALTTLDNKFSCDFHISLPVPPDLVFHEDQLLLLPRSYHLLGPRKLRNELRKRPEGALLGSRTVLVQNRAEARCVARRLHLG